MTKRIMWIDIFRAIAIILMVVGHTTGKFNMFIYQFHMAAFFFISGYASNIRKTGFIETVWKRFCTLWLPLTSMFLLFLALVVVLDFVGVYSVFNSGEFLGAYFVFVTYFKTGDNYINWLGATWFIKVLFDTIILHRLITKAFSDKIGLFYFFISLLLYILGLNSLSPQSFFYRFDLILIGQFYFCVGMILRDKKVLDFLTGKVLINVIFLIITLVGLYYFGIVNPTTVDYPSRRFGDGFLTVFASLNGCLFLFSLSNIISFIPEKINNVFAIISRNTIGVVFFHFLMFKIVYLFLYVFKLEPISVLQSFTPPSSTKFLWPIFTLVSVSASVGLWLLLNKFRVLRIIFGQESKVYERVYSGMIASSVWKKAELTILDLQSKMSELARRIFYYIKENLFLSLVIFILIVLVVAPWMQTGVINNDEVNFRFQAMGGSDSFFNNYEAQAKAQGRMLALFTSIVYIYLNFTYSSILYFELVGVFINVLSIVLFCILINMLIGSKTFACLLGVLLISFMPVTFEHTMPNAFNGSILTGFPILLMSMILFASYKKSERKLRLILSIPFLLLSLMTYESFIMLTPMYLVISYRLEQCGDKNLLKALKSCLPFILTSIVYLIIYVSLRVFFPSGYGGTQLTFTSIQSSFNIIAQLFLSGIPGYYLFHPRTEYIFMISNDGAGEVISSGNPLMLLRYFVLNALNFRIFLLCCALIIIFILINKLLIKEVKFPQPSTRKNLWISCGIGIVFMILPSIPTSLASMYQGSVNKDSFTALPCSYFIYFAAVFVLSALVWQIVSALKWKKVKLWIVGVIFLAVISVQTMNGVLAARSEKDYSRMVSIEKVINTETFKKFAENNIIFAPDFYETRDALAFKDGYWTNFANLKGITTQIVNGTNESNNALVVAYYLNDDYFCIKADNIVAVLSSKPLNGIYPIQVDQDTFLSAKLDAPFVDGQFYVQCFLQSNGELKSVDANVLNEVAVVAGNDLLTAKKLIGYYSDGWLEQESRFLIKTGPAGKVRITGYYPNEINDSLTGKVSVNDGEATTFSIEEPTFEIVVDAPTNQIVELNIANDFYFDAVLPDMRKLCFILAGLDGE